MPTPDISNPALYRALTATHLENLKRQYFALVPSESYPNTPALTARLDRYEKAIRTLAKTLAVKP